MILAKSKVVSGNITNENIFNDIFNEHIDVVINSAAFVKHYGDYDLFYKNNILGVENLINYCLKQNARLVQMSTLSVSGNILEAGQTIQKNIKTHETFGEDNLYINQNIENVYVNTKFIAEVKILEAMLNFNLNAQIVRLGNLTGRLSDGKFQPNVEDNAFSNRIKSLIALNAISSDMYKKYIEMTPIDVVSVAIDKIIQIENSNIIYHLFNHNHIPMPNFINVIKSLGVKIQVLDKASFTKLIKTCMQSESNLSLIQGIIPDISEDGSLEYNDNITIKSEYTKEYLERLILNGLY